MSPEQKLIQDVLAYLKSRKWSGWRLLSVEIVADGPEGIRVIETLKPSGYFQVPSEEPTGGSISAK